ncbi:hypothetical protein EI94DRAFT_1808886 [Lactarius quietus]|nr:hypothetical protein EI94DRAFT_1808886 [Lactarius quietus]
MGPAAEYSREELQYFRADFRGKRQVDEALARLGDISLQAEVRCYHASMEVVVELKAAIKKLEDDIFVHIDRARHSAARLGRAHALRRFALVIRQLSTVVVGSFTLLYHQPNLHGFFSKAQYKDRSLRKALSGVLIQDVTPVSLSPLDSLTSDSEGPEDSDSSRPQPDSEEEVLLILSHNSAANPAPRGVTTRTRARQLVQQATTTLAAEPENRNSQATASQSTSQQNQQLASTSQNQSALANQPLHVPPPPPLPANPATVTTHPLVPQLVMTTSQTATTVNQATPPNIPLVAAPHPPLPAIPPAAPNPPNPLPLPQRMLLADLPGQKVLYNRHGVTTEPDKKTGALKYLTTTFLDRIWCSCDTFADATKTYDEFKAELYESYLGSDKDVFTMNHLDALIGERVQLSNKNTTEPGQYHFKFKAVTNYLISKNRMLGYKQSRAFW